MIELPRIERDTVLRTPDARFAGIADFPYEPRYRELGGLRIAYIDEGPAAAAQFAVARLVGKVGDAGETRVRRAQHGVPLDPG